MSAHINFDLGIAAAEVAKGHNIRDMKADFMKVNDILADMTNSMQEKIGRCSRLLILLDWIGGRNDEKIANFNIKKARQFAWTVANALAFAEGLEKEKLLEEFDLKIAKFNKAILKPPGKLLNFILKIISRFEEKNTLKIIENMKLD